MTKVRLGKISLALPCEVTTQVEKYKAGKHCLLLVILHSHRRDLLATVA